MEDGAAGRQRLAAYLEERLLALAQGLERSLRQGRPAEGAEEECRTLAVLEDWLDLPENARRAGRLESLGRLENLHALPESERLRLLRHLCQAGLSAAGTRQVLLAGLERGLADLKALLAARRGNTELEPAAQAELSGRWRSLRALMLMAGLQVGEKAPASSRVESWAEALLALEDLLDKAMNREAAPRERLRALVLRRVLRLAERAREPERWRDFQRCAGLLPFLGRKDLLPALLRCQVMLCHAGSPGIRFGPPAPSKGQAKNALLDLAADLYLDGLPGRHARRSAEPDGRPCTGGNGSTGGPAFLRDAALKDVALAELARLGTALEDLTGPGTVREVLDPALLPVLYKLRRDCAALDLTRFAAVFATAGSVLLGLRIVRPAAGQAPSEKEARALQDCLRALGRHFQEYLAGLGRPSSVRRGTGHADEGEIFLSRMELLLLRFRPGGALRKGKTARFRIAEAVQPESPLPLRVTRGLVLLPLARAEWFAGAARLVSRRRALVAELRLLEQAAARLRLCRIEFLAGALREVYALWEASNLQAPLPWKLLARAHRHLRRMLNQAAAWQEVRPARQLVALLYAWTEAQRDGGVGTRQARLPPNGQLLREGLAHLLADLGRIRDGKEDARTAAGELMARVVLLGEILDKAASGPPRVRGIGKPPGPP